MSAPFARLAARRTLPRALVLATLISGLLAVTTLRTSQTPFESGLDPGATARAGAWTLMAIALGPWLVFRAAATVARWRRGEIDWLASTPASRLQLMVSAWFGTFAASLAVVAVVATVAELTVPVDRSTFALRTRLETPERAVIDGSNTLRWSSAVPEVRPGSKLRLQLAFVPIEVFADVEWSATRGSERTEVRQRVFSRCALDVDAPSGSGEVTFELARVEGGGIVLFDEPGLAVLEPGASSRASSTALALHCALVLAAWSALALGFGAWMRPTIAFASLAALSFATFVIELDALAAFLPWIELAKAFDSSSRGVVPAWPTWSAYGSTIALVATGLALACAGTRRWRIQP